ncbi:plancitoxin-1-like isoform X3 [Liolophura sinensis]|uniref:plancitoxin-1-like isoform X1 n=1 Tax=Liolophura sinensis TaxID=3198878 RepID=UPI0031585762
MNTWLTLIAFSACLSDAVGLQCLNDAGKPVDWFIVYKLPTIPESSHPLVKEGVGHFYMDVTSPQWSLSDVSVNSSGHAVYNTLKQIYGSSGGDVAYVMYNDEKPTGQKTESYGHTKGVVGFDRSVGFWLVHSTPKFPPAKTEGYNWPETALHYGQSFLCVTYNYNSLDIIGTQFHYNYPWVYDFSMPDGFKQDNINLTKYLESTSKPHPKSPPWNSLRPLVSKGGDNFISFAKFNSYDEDLYSSWIAPFLNSPLKTETWQNGRGKLPSNCTTKLFKVYNIEKISLPEQVAFAETKDHSKWAVTTAGNPPWVCIGDINRQEHQLERAGGTVCFKHQMVHDQFAKSVAAYEDCK